MTSRSNEEILEQWERDRGMGPDIPFYTAENRENYLCDLVERGRQQGAAEQREKDAKICEQGLRASERMGPKYFHTYNTACKDLAEAIRAQGKKGEGE